MLRMQAHKMCSSISCLCAQQEEHKGRATAGASDTPLPLLKKAGCVAETERPRGTSSATLSRGGAGSKHPAKTAPPIQ